jgi:hypothetical protein
VTREFHDFKNKAEIEKQKFKKEAIILIINFLIKIFLKKKIILRLKNKKKTWKLKCKKK